MKKLFKNMKENEKGFTLIELIVVIAIIGILAAVLLPKFSGFTDKARENAARSEAKNIYTAYAAVQSEKGVAVLADVETGIKDYLGKLPKSGPAVGSPAVAPDITAFVKKATAATDPVIEYTTVVNGKSYEIKIIEGGDIKVTAK